jgi:predicted ATPase/transcriptional regulator with XRE-family HTH domain
MDDASSFGPWLRKRRKACDLTQAELARRVGCVEGTIRKFEADELRPSRQVAGLLATHLGLPPAEHAAFVAFARVQVDGGPPLPPIPAGASPPSETTPPSSPQRPRHNLPVPATALIGREREVAAVCALFCGLDLRLVTLTGPGGVGKTRLALQVAADLLDVFPEGVYVVSLASLRDSNLVIATVAQTLGVRETGGQSLFNSLVVCLRRKRILLLLDNFEHLLEAAPLVADLLASCPTIAVLVTSRAPLRLCGEQEFAVPSLELPPPIKTTEITEVGRVAGKEVREASASTVAELIQYAAVRLFTDRAGSLRPGFALTPESGSAVAAICQRLDGLPLAIELAAAWVRLFEPAALLARLANPLALLTLGARDLPDRQRTLRATIDWSYHLLDEAEQALFARLSVFMSGCTLDAIEAVCNANGDLSVTCIARVASLIEKNLLRSGAGLDGQPRLAMLETIHSYARERLDAREETTAFQQRHATYYLTLAEAGEALLRGPAQRRQWEWLEIEYDNLRTALGWSLGGGDAETGVRLAGALSDFWDRRGYLSEGRGWLAAALAQSSVTTATRAKAFAQAARLALTQGDYPAASTLLEASMILFRELGRSSEVAEVLNTQGHVALNQGDEKRAVALFEESLALSREIRHDRSAAWTLWSLGHLARSQRDYARAGMLYDEGLALFESLGDTRGIGFTLWALGNLARSQKDDIRAAVYYDEALALAQKAGDRAGIASARHKQSYLALHRGDHARAEALLLESLALSRDIELTDQIAWDLAGLGGVAAAQGRPERAVRLLAAAAAWFDSVGHVLDPTERDEHDRYIAAARAQLNEETFNAAWAEGRTLTLDQAVAEVLGTTNKVRDPYREGQ